MILFNSANNTDNTNNIRNIIILLFANHLDYYDLIHKIAGSIPVKPLLLHILMLEIQIKQIPMFLLPIDLNTLNTLITLIALNAFNAFNTLIDPNDKSNRNIQQNVRSIWKLKEYIAAL
ncbi:uncharacterized protein ASCRUDRAFT_5914 [Ascoidea rubescens DSM 1968]|uniref:Uncharacterized protein n=1 Tax=Ascoidea rubescens DSM 1968 TaxID=1344418 RepID=A0A1D2VQY5_9ASCO|nr:hypothetical protein ASCRUDRAFT_5914 [Ascoidea rubescens DSM 1968]ODV64026.1 hypothetical protein ASCRUDRAFT_5914 [Ascoidea rubescens DSM 1968]